MTMKLWQLDSILNDSKGNRSLSTKIAATKEEWHYLTTWFSDIVEYYNRRDRSVLDAELPEDFVKKVLEESGIVCYKYGDDFMFGDGLIGSYKYDGSKEVSAIEVYLQYGGDVLEQVFDRGAVKVN